MTHIAPPPLAVLLCACFVFLPSSARAQMLADTTFTWEGYSRTSTCRVQIFKAPAGEDRTHTIVVHELAENRGRSTTDDARYLVELIGRRFGVDPAAAYWVFYWGAFSFGGADTKPVKELFLRATFRRTKSQQLSSPYWRVVTRSDVETYADRRFR